VTGIGLTLGLGAVLIWSLTDTLAARDRYVQHPTEADYNDGVSRQSRTYGLLGGVAVLGTVTLLVAAFATNWHASFLHNRQPQRAQSGWVRVGELD
jgi:hypothetical protein